MALGLGEGGESLQREGAARHRRPPPVLDTPVRPQVEPHVRRAGQYLIGPRLGVSPVKSIVHCLGRKEGTDRYFLLKILQLVIGAKESQVSRAL